MSGIKMKKIVSIKLYKKSKIINVPVGFTEIEKNHAYQIHNIATKYRARKIKGLCVVCKFKKLLSRHHGDYREPLKTERICDGCHQIIHSLAEKIMKIEYVFRPHRVFRKKIKHILQAEVS